LVTFDFPLEDVKHAERGKQQGLKGKTSKSQGESGWKVGEIHIKLKGRVTRVARKKGEVDCGQTKFGPRGGKSAGKERGHSKSIQAEGGSRKEGHRTDTNNKKLTGGKVQK